MKDANKKAIAGLLEGLAIFAVLLFVPAWTLRYWQAWVFLCVYLTPLVAILLYLMKKDPKLFERRVGKRWETRPTQKIIQAAMLITFIALMVSSSLDHRFGWSHVPAYATIDGDAVVVLGFVIVFFVFRENTYTSAVIEIDADQRVISTGPYAVVRHPMYSGAIVLVAGMAPALGSWWGLLGMIPMTAVIVWRLLDEEKFLAASLPGYSEYLSTLKWRLAPYVW